MIDDGGAKGPEGHLPSLLQLFNRQSPVFSLKYRANGRRSRRPGAGCDRSSSRRSSRFRKNSSWERLRAAETPPRPPGLRPPNSATPSRSPRADSSGRGRSADPTATADNGDHRDRCPASRGTSRESPFRLLQRDARSNSRQNLLDVLVRYSGGGDLREKQTRIRRSGLLPAGLALGEVLANRPPLPGLERLRRVALPTGARLRAREGHSFSFGRRKKPGSIRSISRRSRRLALNR